MKENILKEAEKYRVYCKKHVDSYLSIDEETVSAKEWLLKISDFLKSNNLEDAEININVSGCGGCGGYLDYVKICAEVDKTEEEISQEIKNIKTHRNALAKEKRLKKKALEDCEFQTLLRLQKKFKKRLESDINKA